MYTTTAAFAAFIAPSNHHRPQRVMTATLCFAAGAIVGWPFSLALAIPFVFEELFVLSGDKVPSTSRASWMAARWGRLLKAGVLSSLLLVWQTMHIIIPLTDLSFKIPVVLVDSIAYGKLTITPWNIVAYNVFGDAERGPNLYGTSPSSFYLFNLLLNFNVLLPLALLSIPGLLVTYAIDRKRLGSQKPTAEESSPFTVLALRLAPFYVWLAILSAQEHKRRTLHVPRLSTFVLQCSHFAVLNPWMDGVNLC